MIELDPIVQTWFKVCYVLDEQEMYIFTELLCGKSAKEIAITCPRKKFKNGEFTRLAKGKRSKTGIGVDYSRFVVAANQLKRKVRRLFYDQYQFVKLAGDNPEIKRIIKKQDLESKIVSMEKRIYYMIGELEQLKKKRKI